MSGIDSNHPLAQQIIEEVLLNLHCSILKTRILAFCRTPWRLAVYYHQSRDERILPLLQAQVKFFERQAFISAGYRLDGTAMETYSNIAFQAPVWCLFKVITAEEPAAL